MKRLLLASIFTLAPAFGLVSAAHATPITTPTFALGYSTGNSNITTLVSNVPSPFSQTYSFSGGSVTLSATNFGTLNEFDLSVQGGAKFTSPVTLYLTEQGLTGAGVMSVTGNLTNNVVVTPTASSLTYTLYGSTSNGMYTGINLGTDTISGTQSPAYVYDPAFSATGLYSLTEAIEIVPSASGSTNVSLDGVVNVPEPGSLVLLGTGLVLLGFAVRKRRIRG